MNIAFSEQIINAAPAFKMILIQAGVVNTPTPESLWNEICEYGQSLRDSIAIEQINKRPGIAATRAAYRKCGKDPNRYRPSCEAMMRRLVKGMELYRIDALVDLVNLLSLKSGYSIGGFDADKIIGNSLTLGIGTADEQFEGIGRGVLNIEGLPVYRDAAGGIGTPTSDNERTKMGLDTRNILLTINIYGEDMPVDETVKLAKRLLGEYASATNITHQLIEP